MSNSMLDSISDKLILESEFAPAAYTQEDEQQKTHLSRNHTNQSDVSHLSRIISNIKDDFQQDIDRGSLYNNSTVAAEAAVVDQMDRASREFREERGAEEEDKSLNDSLEENEKQDDQDDDYPKDGLFALWQGFLVMLLVFSTWGANASFGVFLNYYTSTNSFPGATSYDFALIGGIVVFLAQFLAPISGLGIRYLGQMPILLIGLILQFLGYLLASFSTQLWEIYCCQGVLVGVSFALIFIPGTLLLPTWFDKKKSFAMGLAVGGSGLGGVVFSLSINKIIQDTGDQRWALRSVCFMTLASTLVPICFMRPRNKGYFEINKDLTLSRLKADIKMIFNFSVFKNLNVLLCGLWFGVTILCYVIVLYSFSAYATSVGLSHTQSNNLLAIMNALQLVGRPTVGNLGDRFGRSNISALACIYNAIMLLAYWRNVTSYGALIALAVLIGGPIGIGSTMSQSLVADVLEQQGKIELLPAAWSGLNMFAGLFSLPSEVIAIALKDKYISNTYDHAQIFTGSVFFLALLIALVNREYVVRKTFERRLLQTQALISGEKTEEENVDSAVLSQRQERYTMLGRKTIMMYFARMFYPILV